MTGAAVWGEEFGGRVAILLGTLNGARFLSEQLRSFEAQTHENWHIWASDDGSSDQTHEILEAWSAKFEAGRATILHGPGEGFVANFQSLIGDEDIRADYFAFSDQDDVWMADKLDRAVACLRSTPFDVPAIYCSRTEMIDHNGKRIGVLSPLFLRAPSFANALVQSIAGGNTMVLNRAARNLMGRYANLAPVSHDWWAYQLVTGVGGRLIYDVQPSIYYRQHDGNLIGHNLGMKAKLYRLKMLMGGVYAAWNEINVTCLGRAWSSLTLESRILLSEFESIRSARSRKRVLSALNNPFYRQKYHDSIAMTIALIIGKF